MSGNPSPPKLHAHHFTCPACGIYAEHTWQIIFSKGYTTLYISSCQNCKNYLLWKNEQILDPPQSSLYPPHYLSPDKAKIYYIKAQLALHYDLIVAYTYLKHAIYQLIEYMRLSPVSTEMAVEDFKKRALGSYKLWYDLEKMGFLDDTLGCLQLEEQRVHSIAQLELGFELFNRTVQECIAQPASTLTYFAQLPEQNPPIIDGDFFEKE